MFKNSENKIRSGWMIAMAGVLVIVGQIAFGFPGAIFMVLKEMAQETSTEISITGELLVEKMFSDPLGFFMIQGLGMVGSIAGVLIAFRGINKVNPNKIKLGGPAKDMFFGLFLGGFSMLVIFFILQLVGQVQLENSLLAPTFSTYTWVSLIVFIFVGVFEELFFRGYVMETMALRKNPKQRIYIVSALIFGLAHILNANVSILGILNIILVGFLFAYMFDKTESLLLPIGYHITWNYFQGPILGFEVSGNATQSLYAVNTSQGHALITGGDFGIEGGLMATLLILLGFLITKWYSGKRSSSLLG